MTAPVIGVIEWSLDNATEPAVFLADSADDVRKAVLLYLTPIVGDLDYIKETWIRDHPIPHCDDAPRVAEWLRDLRAETTDAWLTLYEAGSEPSFDTYQDARANRIPEEES